MSARKLLIFALILNGSLVACTPLAVSPTPTATVPPSPTHTPSPLPTETPLPTPTDIPTATRVPPTETPIPKPTLDVFPTGSFQAQAPEGLLTFTFEADGTWRKFLNKSFLDSGTYTLEGFKITLDAVECKRILNGPATYKWSYDGETLAFKPDGADPCAPREYFTRRKFTRVP